MARGRREGILIAGGGVAGCLAALAMARHRPEVPLLIVEEGERFGGDHFYAAFGAELADDAAALVASLAEQRWPGFYVAFPGASRKLKGDSLGFGAAALHAAMVEALDPKQYRLGTRIVAVREDALVLDGGEELKAEGALDARGAANLSMLELLYEARLEREYRTPGPHGVDRPVLVDATVGQTGGLGYVQVMPLGADRLLIAEVMVAERGQPDEQARARLDHYATLRGWSGAKLEAERSLARPLPMGGDFSAFWRIGGARVAKLGLRGGFIHPVTGRTVADAARLGLLLTRQRDFSGAALHDVFEEEARQQWKSREPLRAITRQLAESPPEERRSLIERLYRLDPALIGRFHAGDLGMIDRLRVQRALARD